MKYIIKLVFFLLVCSNVLAQQPSGFPFKVSPPSWYQMPWLKTDSGLALANRDTTTINPRFSFSLVGWQHNGVDSSLWYNNGSRWIKLASGGDVLSPGTGLQQVGNTIAIAPSGVTAGVYSIPTYQVNLQGQIIKSGSGLLNQVGSGTSNFFTSNRTVGSLTIVDLNTRLLHDTTYLSWHIRADGSLYGLVDTAGLRAAIGGGGGSGNTNSNIGLGYRWAVPGTNNIKTGFVVSPLLIDSTTNSNALTFKFDTTIIHTSAYNDGRYLQAATSIPPNIGAGFRVYSPQVPGFKTFFATANAGILIDSSTNTNGLTFKVDSSVFATKYFVNNLPFDTLHVVTQFPTSGTYVELKPRSNGLDSLFFPVLIAGTNITLSKGSDSAITINASGTSVLTSAHLFVGNGSNVATDVAASGDLSLANTGAFTIANNAITTAKINANAVTNAKMATSTANSLAGYDGSGNFSDVTVGSGLAESGGVLSSTGVPEQLVGSLFNRIGTFTALSFGTTNGSGQTNSATGGNIKMISDASSSAGRSLDLDSLIGRSGSGKTDMEHWIMTVGYIAQAKTTNKLVRIGLRSYIGALNNNLIAELDLSNNAGSGKLKLYDQVFNLVETSTSALSFSAGDSVTLSVERRADKIYVVAQDVTTKSNQVTMTPFTFFFQNGGALNDIPNGGKFAIYNSADTQVVYSVNIFSTETKFPAVMCITDSKGYLYTGNYNNTWVEQLQVPYGSVVRNGGSSETAGDALGRTNEIIAIRPRTILLSVGRNGGLPDTTNYSSLVTALRAAGITVINCIEPYDAAWAAAGAATFIAYIGRNPADGTINTYTPTFYCPDCIAGDAVHLTPLGATVVANTIVQANLIARGSYTNPLYGSGNVNDLALWSTQQNAITSDDNLSYTSSGGLSVGNPGTFTKSFNGNELLSIVNATNASGASAGVVTQSDNYIGELFTYSTSHTATNILCAGCTGVYSNSPALVLVSDQATGSIRFGAGSGSVPNEQMRLNASGHLLLNTTTDHSKILDINGGIWQNKDSLVISSTGSVMSLGIDTATGNYVRFAGSGSGAVSSVFGRTGAVVAVTNDYSFSQISGSVADGQLSSNVPLKNATNTFSVGQTISNAGGVTAGLNIISSGASSYSSVTLTNNGSFTGQLFLTGSTYSPTGVLSANGLGFYSNGAGGIDIWADNNGPILFSAKATTGVEGMRLNTNNEFQIGSTSDQGAFTLQNTGGFYQNGSFSLRGTLAAPSTALPLLVKGTDSVVYQIAQSSLTGVPNIYNANGTVAANRTVTQSGHWIDFTGEIYNKHLYGNGTAPTIVAGLGAGTTPTVSLDGSDQAGIITVIADVSAATGATIVTITYNSTYASKATVILEPANAAANGLSGTSGVFVNDASSDATKFIMTSGTVGLTGATTYKWYYHVIGYDTSF